MSERTVRENLEERARSRAALEYALREVRDAGCPPIAIVDALDAYLEARERSRESEVEQAYDDGESSQLADWEFALNEIGGFPDDFNYTPTAVAREVAALRAEIEGLRHQVAAVDAVRERYEGALREIAADIVPDWKREWEGVATWMQRRARRALEGGSE